MERTGDARAALSILMLSLASHRKLGYLNQVAHRLEITRVPIKAFV